MRHPVAAVLSLATLAACGSEGPSTPGATASFSASARVVSVRCELPNCPPPLGVAIAVRVTESGGIIGGYVTMMDFVLRDEASGRVLGSQHYDAAQIASMTQVESNQVYPSAWVEILAHPFRFTGSEQGARTVTVAISVTDYHGHEHDQTVIVSID